jgi:hypothetical protein
VFKGNDDNETSETMPGTINKIHAITCFSAIVNLGGLPLVMAVLTAKTGTPFLTVLTRHQMKIQNDMKNQYK